MRWMLVDVQTFHGKNTQKCQGSLKYRTHVA